MNFSNLTSAAEVLKLGTELPIRDEGDSIVWGPDSRRNTGSVPSVLRSDEMCVRRDVNIPTPDYMVSHPEDPV